MKRALVTTLVMLFIFSYSDTYSQPSKIKKSIKELKKNESFVKSAVSISVMNSKGKIIAGWNSNMPLLTASTMKTITTGLALEILGPDHRFKTSIAISGKIQDSLLSGDLYIIGGGDPTLGSSDTIAKPSELLFSEWREFLLKKGINAIDGNIVADDSYFINEIIPDTWSWSNIGEYYGSGPSGLSFNENMQILVIDSIGKDSTIHSTIWPEIPNMTTTKKIRIGSSYNLTYYTSDLSKTSVIKGTIPNNNPRIVLRISNKFPGVTCANEFKKYLLKGGFNIAGSAVESNEFSSCNKNNMKDTIGITYSPKLKEIVMVTNKISNNFYAETLLRHIGKKINGDDSYSSSIAAVRKTLKNKNLPIQEFLMADGSGLSRQNYVSSNFFVQYLRKMKESPNFVLLFNSLPQPGKDGTLKSVLESTQADIKERIHAKSGSLSNVKCYAGYVVNRADTLQFAILTNNYTVPTSKMMIGIESFMKSLILKK